jgi:hypothetical protein
VNGTLHAFKALTVPLVPSLTTRPIPSAGTDDTRIHRWTWNNNRILYWLIWRDRWYMERMEFTVQRFISTKTGRSFFILFQLRNDTIQSMLHAVC